MPPSVERSPVPPGAPSLTSRAIAGLHYELYLQAHSALLKLYLSRVTAASITLSRLLLAAGCEVTVPLYPVCRCASVPVPVCQCPPGDPPPKTELELALVPGSPAQPARPIHSISPGSNMGRCTIAWCTMYHGVPLHCTPVDTFPCLPLILELSLLGDTLGY